MGALISRIFGTYYLKRVRQDSTVLHYRRTPTWRSFVLFVVLFAFTHIISTQAEFPYLGYLCYALGVYFCYIGTEKYEPCSQTATLRNENIEFAWCGEPGIFSHECIFDKSKGTVSLMNARFLEKFILGYRKKIVTELSEIVAVSVENQNVSPGGVGYQVVLLFLSGLTLSLTAQCTFGDKSEHEAIAREITKFLDLPSHSAVDKSKEDSDQPQQTKHKLKKPRKQKGD